MTQYAATGQYRASDIGEPGKPVRHAVIGPRGRICMDDCSSWFAAAAAAADLNRRGPAAIREDEAA